MNKIKEYVTRKELSKIANKLENDQDKFIIFALYHGIAGFRELSELRELKVSDIDFKRKIIHVGDREIEMDTEFYKIAKRAIEQKTYYVEMLNRHTASEFQLNTDCEYVIRCKQVGSNSLGLRSMKYSGLRSRFKLIKQKTDMDCSPSGLETSGVINRLLEIKKDWTSREIDYCLTSWKLRFSAYRVYKIMKEVKDLN